MKKDEPMNYELVKKSIRKPIKYIKDIIRYNTLSLFYLNKDKCVVSTPSVLIFHNFYYFIFYK